jgi:mercuric ion binding protein
MKTFLVSSIIAVATVLSAHAADVTSKLSEVHLCCGSCVSGVKDAVSDVQGVTPTVDRTNRTVTLTGPDAATLQKAVDSLVAAGFYGKTDGTVKISSDTGAKGEKVQKMKIQGLHLCCGKCVTTVNSVLKTVPGVTGNTAKTDAETFEVTGDFTDTDVMNALQKEGMTGKVVK